MTQLKHCVICKQPKPIILTAKRNSKESGFNGARCWACYCQEYAKRRHAARHASPEALAKHNAASCRSAKANRGRANAQSAKQKLAKLNRTPPWANLDKIQAIYMEASRKGLEVDHVIPLLGKTVSGLHVENNLQLLPKSANRRKSNKYELK